MRWKVIDCESDERLLRRLLEAPHTFDQATCESLVDRFRSRLTIDDILAIMAKRLRRGEHADSLERNAVLAIVEGRMDDADRLLDVLERRNRAGLRVVARGPASPPRSS